MATIRHRLTPLAILFCLSPFVAGPAVAQSTAPVAAPPDATATVAPLQDAYAMSHVVGPLREIARMKARNAPSKFCLSFKATAAPAAFTALAYERRLLDAAHDIRNFRLDNDLAKRQSMRSTEADITYLATMARTGHAELQALRAQYIDKDDPQAQAVVKFVDALDGAKGRQLELSRDLASNYGLLAELKVYSIADSYMDSHVMASKDESASLHLQSAANTENPYVDLLGRPYQAEELFSLPGDEEIGKDLERAATYAAEVETLGNC